MMQHSFDKYWSRQDLTAKREKRAGRPGHEWTETRERQLFRLVAQLRVPWKDIPTAMKEPPAAPGQEAFAPSKGACRDHWHKITGMNPSETHVRNLYSRKKQRERVERAFKLYQQRQEASSAPTIDGFPGFTGPSILPYVLGTSADGLASHATGSYTPDCLEHEASEIEAEDPLSPALTFGGATPSDSALSISGQGPEHSSFMPIEAVEQSVFKSVERALDVSSHRNANPASKKRPASSVFGESIEATLRRHTNRKSTASFHEESEWVQQCPDASQDSHRGSNPSLAIARLQSVEEEPGALANHRTAVDKLEDDMGYSRGIIHFVKYRLTKTRNSFISMISSRRSSNQSFVQCGPEDTQPFHYSSYVERDDLSVATQPMQPDHISHRPRTNIFLELRLAGATDNYVANRLKYLLQDVGLENAWRITNTRSSAGETALEVALALGNIPACKVLLENGADVCEKTSNGATLSEFGRAAQKSRENNNCLYYAIGTCRNEILSHSLMQQGQKSGKAKGAKGRATVGKSQLGKIRSGSAQSIQNHNDDTLNAYQMAKRLSSGHQSQGKDKATLPTSDLSIRPTHLSGNTSISGNDGSYWPDTSSMAIAHPPPFVAPPDAIVLGQTIPPSVSQLVADINQRTLAAQQPVLPSGVHTTTYNTPRATLPLIPDRTGPPDIHNPMTLDNGMLPMMGHPNLAPAAGTTLPISGGPFGHIEQLSDGRFAFIYSDVSAVHGVPVSQNPHYSLRDARPFEYQPHLPLMGPYASAVPDSCALMDNNTQQLPYSARYLNPRHPPPIPNYSDASHCSPSNQHSAPMIYAATPHLGGNFAHNAPAHQSSLDNFNVYGWDSWPKDNPGFFPEY